MRTWQVIALATALTFYAMYARSAELATIPAEYRGVWCLADHDMIGEGPDSYIACDGREAQHQEGWAVISARSVDYFNYSCIPLRVIKPSDKAAVLINLDCKYVDSAYGTFRPTWRFSVDGNKLAILQINPPLK